MKIGPSGLLSKIACNHQLRYLLGYHRTLFSREFILATMSNLLEQADTVRDCWHLR